MSTTLAEQLRNLSVPSTNVLKDDKKRTTLLFNPKEAATISGEVIYEIGLEGLEQLIIKNNSFIQFRDSLFHVSSKDFDRNVQSKEDNSKLNKTVKKFLAMLAPYILTNPAHKAMEWLFYRYAINEFNKQDLIMVALPYYNSNIFSRIIQTLKFNESADPFYFLKTVQKSGMHLQRLDLFYQALSNARIIKLLTKFMTQLMNIHTNYSVLTTQFNFYCTIFCGAIEFANEISEPFISEMLPLILKGLNSSIPDFAAASYVITARLLSKGSLTPKLLNTLLEKVSELPCPSLKQEATLMVVLIYQLQKQYEELPSTALANFSNGNWIATSLQYLQSKGNYIYPCLKVLVQKALHQAIQEEEAASRNLVVNIVNEIEFDGEFVKQFLCVLLEEIDTETTNDELTAWVRDIVQKLQVKYPSDLDVAMGDLVKDDDSVSMRKMFMRTIFESVNVSYATKFQMLENLYSCQQSVKEDIFKDIAKSFASFNSSDQYLFCNLLCEKLHHKNHKTVERTLELILKTDIGETKLLQSSLIELFNNEKVLVKKWEKSYILAAIFMIKEQAFTWDLFLCLFPFIVLYHERQFNEIRDLFKLKFFANFAQSDIVNCANPKRFMATLLRSLESNFDDQVLEDCLQAKTSSVISKYSAITILSHLVSNISLLNDSTINKIFKMFSSIQKESVSTKESTLQGYLEMALKNKCPLKGVIECMDRIIIKSLDKDVNWAAVDFAKTSVFVTALCSLAFKNPLFANMFDSYLDKVSSDVNIKMNVSLNICASGIIKGNVVCKVLHFIQSQMLVGDKIINFDKFTCLYLLVLLSNASSDIRKSAFDLANYLVAKESNKHSSNYVWLLQQLLAYKEEIILDCEQFSLICLNVLTRNTESKKNTKAKSALADLLMTCCSSEASLYVKAGILKALKQINNFEILETLCEHFVKLFKDQSIFEKSIILDLISRLDMDVLTRISLKTSIWRFIVFVLKSKKAIAIDMEKRYLPSILLSQLSRGVYDVLAEDVLAKLLDIICEISVSSEEPEIGSMSSKIFKHLDLNAKVISNLLTAITEVQSTRAISTKNRRVHVVPTIDILDTIEWKKGICALEFIQGKKKIRNGQYLLPILFNILKKCLDFEEQALVEYPKQLTLSLILLVCSKLDEESISEKDFNIELVIQCIRASQNPQTHYHALLALAHAAKFVPNKVLHHVMAVFTFMGSTLVRHDDAYSFEIIAKIVDTIVPILVSGNHVTTITDVLRVFVDALLDVPEHRRIPLYTKLLKNINTKENFHLFLILVLEAEVFQASREKRKIEKGVTSQRIKIALVLCQEFSPEITLHSCVLLAKYLNDLPDEKDDMARTQNVNSLINISNYNAKQFRHYKYLIITFLSSLLSSRSFVNNISLLSDKDNINMEPLYKELIINVLAYIQRIQRVCEKAVNTPQALYWKTVLYHSYDLLDSVNDLLTPHMFLLVIKGLLVHSLHTVKKRALELLNSKLQYNFANFKDQEKAELYILIKPILLIIETIEQGNNMQSDQEILIQTALLSLKLIVKTLAPEEPEKFVQILDFVASILNSGKARDNVLASVILCLAELCIALRGHGIAGLTSFMPAFLTILKNQKYQETSSMLLLSVITTVNKLLDSFAAFLSPYLTKLICETSVLISKWNSSADDPKTQALVNRLNGIKKKISVVIPPRILIPTVEDCYKTLIAKKYYNALIALIDILEEQVLHLQSTDVTQNMTELTNFFLKTLEFRSDNSAIVTLDIANVVEDQVVKTISVFILKLSESTFRPFYLKLYDWAVRAGSNRERLITFYHLSEAIGHALKGLFVLFAGNIINNLSDTLRSINDTTSDSVNKTILLLEFILKTLHVIFTHDNKKLINRDRFELLMQPLIDLLEKDIDGIDALIKRNETLITPTIVQFSLAIADDSLWKEMNYQILLKMRNSIPEVRLVALHCLAEVVSKLREDFLPLLPETIPFLAELLEDEDERVERSCQKTIREMEKVLGEPLQKYF